MATETPKSVLIVEDEVQLRDAIKESLEREHLTVLAAKNGEEGLKLAIEKHPDIILLDIVMPVMDGMTMLKHLRLDKWGKTAKVIMLTNLSDEERVATAFIYESYDYLVKSDWQLSDIVKKVHEKLSS